MGFVRDTLAMEPVINWTGSNKDAAVFQRFFRQTLGYDILVGDLLKVMTMIAGFDETDAQKDEMVARIDGGRTNLDWIDYK